MVERIDKNRIVGLSGTDLDKFVEHDFLMRSGMCPNGHGLMTLGGWGQECPQCHFTTNVQPELDKQ